ncbi:hypothetical protein GBA52_016058 [Prunus armeniaca]|nr:hypothetical protein GBA52_016058 [Prunus armeniaca]
MYYEANIIVCHYLIVYTKLVCMYAVKFTAKPPKLSKPTHLPPSPPAMVVSGTSLSSSSRVGGSGGEKALLEIRSA